jgi:hypothetical protein
MTWTLSVERRPADFMLCFVLERGDGYRCRYTIDWAMTRAEINGQGQVWLDIVHWVGETVERGW